MRQVWKSARKIIISLIGFPLFIVGVILIPIPGPGLLISFLALFILSLEFDWANKQLDKIKKALKKIYETAKARADRIENLGDKGSQESINQKEVARKR
jgi:uncharacterized protein (TIGR02611 family)